MEVSTEDVNSASVLWSNRYSASVGGTGTAIGTGYANTEAIINQEGHTSSAAQECRDYAGGDETDWYLPSKNELHAVSTNIVTDSSVNESSDEVKDFISGLGTYTFFSSSEISSSVVYGVRLSSNVSFNLGKSSYIEHVRAVRSF